ncbi:membrane protein insertion efficiency factor YidD [Candidatus Riflebacteria bacterium]
MAEGKTRRNIMARLAIVCVKSYQRFISPLLPRNICRFSPSCSQYMIESLEKYGLLQGLIKGVYRLLRCNPFCEGGHDPV